MMMVVVVVVVMVVFGGWRCRCPVNGPCVRNCIPVECITSRASKSKREVHRRQYYYEKPDRQLQAGQQLG